MLSELERSGTAASLNRKVEASAAASLQSLVDIARTWASHADSGLSGAFEPASAATNGLDDSAAHQRSDGLRVIVEHHAPMAPLDRERLQYFEVSSRLEVLQSWEGVVQSVDDEEGEFSARLTDLTNPAGSDREAILDICEVSDNDRDLLRVGGVFRWMIGYRRHSYGKMERVSSIDFRRLPAWYDDDIAKARAEGEALAAAFTGA